MPRPALFKCRTNSNAWVPFRISLVRDRLVEFRFCRGCTATIFLFGFYALCLPCPAKLSPQNSTPQNRQEVIARIVFLGNRRVRSDTLKARIFSREGDGYNEETLRRDFQALWNTQLFEDVKLRVEDSPAGAA